MALHVMVLRPAHVRIQGENIRQMANANVNRMVWTVMIMHRVPVTMVRYVVRMENVDPVLAGPANNRIIEVLLSNKQCVFNLQLHFLFSSPI